MVDILVYDDKKEKYQSCEASFSRPNVYKKISMATDVYSYDLSDLIGYGATQEEAIHDLIASLDYVIAELNALRTNIDCDVVSIKPRY